MTMEVVYGIDSLAKKGRFDPVGTMGTFDGVHLGHQAIIKEVEERSKRSNRIGMLITFEPHPQSVVAPETAPLLLSTIDEKLDILSQTDLDVVLIIPFTKEFSRMGFQDFIETIMVDKIGAKRLVVGCNHAFGRDRRGRLPALKGLGEKYGFKVDVVPPMEVDDLQVSSTRIRKLVVTGDVFRASRLLGRFYSLRGWVVRGDERGRIINYPTANLELNSERKLCPANGVYAVRVRVEGEIFQGLMNIGHRPTFDSSHRTIEVHLLGFGRDIYGAALEVEVIDRIRDERKFDSQTELAEQIENDKREVVRLLSEKRGDHLIDVRQG